MAPGAIEHAAVLFTDLVGSTALRSRLGEEVADELRRIHDELLRVAVEEHGGRVVKGLGDGIMATFVSTSDAVSAAVAIQQAADSHSRRHRGHAFEVRVGIAAGDVSTEGGDVFGTPVVEASRLCAAAAGGQILAAQVVELLARGRGDHRYVALGDLELKGLPQSVPAVSVAWEPVASSAAVRLAEGLSTAGALPFAGRARLFDELMQAWKAARGGDGRIVLLAGEAGAGKTRLAAELAQYAIGDSAPVLYGRCDEQLDTAFLSFAEALSAALDASPERSAVEVLGPAANLLTRLLPQLLERDPRLSVVAQEDPETDRYRTLVAIGDALGHLAEPDGLLLVLDDLHWADRATAQTVRLLARSGAAARVLIVGTYRSGEVEPSSPFGEILGELQRAACVSRLAVEGLDLGGLAELLDAASGDDAYHPEQRDRLAALLFEETEGNAFFVGELLRHLVESGALVIADGTWSLVSSMSVPPSVRDVVNSRLGRLSEQVCAALTTASVVGQRFDAELLAAMMGVDRDVAIDCVDPAVGAQLVAEDGVGRYRFEHALVRGALYEGMSLTHRARVHLRIAELLAASRRDDVGALAHHWYQAAGLSAEARQQAIEYSMAAGEQAMATNAPDAALDSFRRALELVDASASSGGVGRADVLIRLGVACRTTGRFDYREHLEAAAEAALADGRPTVAAQAMLEGRGIGFANGDIRAGRRAIQDELARCPDLPAMLRAGVLAQRAGDAFLCRDPVYRDRAVDDAWAALRQIPDHEMRIVTHDTPAAAYASLRLELHAEMLAWTAEAADLKTGREQVLADFILLTGKLRQGQLDAALRHADRMTRSAEQLREPFLLALPLVGRSFVQIAIGNLDAASSDADRFEAAVQTLGDADVSAWAPALRVSLAVQTGRLGDHADLCAVAAEVFPDLGAWAAAAAATLATAGRTAEALGWLDRLAARDFDARCRGGFYTVLLGMAGIAVTRIDTRHRGRILQLLEDIVDVPLCTAGPLNIGSPQHFAGVLRRVMGDLDGAIDRLRQAAAGMEAIGARGYLAQAHAQLAATLAERGHPGDLDEAHRIAAAATTGAQELGIGDVENVCGHLVNR